MRTIFMILVILLMFSCERASRSGQPIPQTNQKVVIVERGYYSYVDGERLYKIKILHNGTIGYTVSKYDYDVSDTIMVAASKIKY